MLWQVGELDVPLLSSLCTDECKSVCYITQLFTIQYSVLLISESMFSTFCTAVDGNMDIRTVTVQKVGLFLYAVI